MISRREQNENRAWGKLYAQMDKNKIQQEIREIEAILNGALGTITASEAAEARQALRHLIDRRKQQLHDIIAEEADRSRKERQHKVDYPKYTFDARGRRVLFEQSRGN